MRKASFLFAAFVLSFHLLHSEIAILDSLKAELFHHTKEDSLRVNLLIQLGNTIRNSNVEEAIKYTEEALFISNRLKWRKGQASSYRQLGAIAQSKGDLVNSLEYFHKALKIAESLPNKVFIASLYNNMGTIYTELAETAKAIEHFNKLVIVSQELNLKFEESLALMNIGFAYQKALENEKAISYLDQSLKIANDSSYYQVSAYAYNNKGIVLNRQLKYNLGIACFLKSIEYSKKSNDKMMEAESIGGLGESYFLLGNYNNAIAYCLKGIELAKQSNALTYERDLQKLISDAYLKLKKDGLALNSFKQYILLRDSIVNDEKKTEIARKEMQFTFDKKEAISKIQASKQRALANAEIKRQQLVKKSAIGFASIILLSSVFSFAFYKRKRDAVEKRSEAEFQSKVSETEMKVLRSQMNPHFIFNSLNSINEFIAKNNLEAADYYISKFSKLMRTVLENSEKKEVQLSDELGALELYIQLESLRLKNKFVYEIIIDPSIDKENTLIPPLILQPFVENSIWHGIAKKEGEGKITISIIRENDMINCIIEDNGIGRKSSVLTTNSNEKRSFGMKITQTRIDILNKLKKSSGDVLLSDLAEGFRVEVRLPLMLLY